jgi:hypothetical protein
VAIIPHGEQLAVTPHIGLSARDPLPRQSATGFLQIVAGQQRLVTVWAQVPEAVRLQLPATECTLKMREIAHGGLLLAVGL